MRRALPVLALLLALALYARLTDAGQTVPGKGWQHIRTVDLTDVDTFTFDATNGFNPLLHAHYKFTFSNVNFDVDGATLRARTSGDSGASDYGYGGSVVFSNNPTTYSGYGSDGAAQCLMNGSFPGNVGYESLSGVVTFMYGDAASSPMLIWHLVYVSTASRVIHDTGSCSRREALEAESVSFLQSSVGFASGTLTIEGYVP